MNLTPEEESALKWWISWTVEDMERLQIHWEYNDRIGATSGNGSKKSKEMIELIKKLHERLTPIPNKRVFL